MYTICINYFFFQAEDGIRDLYVTGVQTCALPIYLRHPNLARVHEGLAGERATALGGPPSASDRKSTRLNSSHVEISYAVFCLKKKNRRSKPQIRMPRV